MYTMYTICDNYLPALAQTLPWFGLIWALLYALLADWFYHKWHLMFHRWQHWNALGISSHILVVIWVQEVTRGQKYTYFFITLTSSHSVVFWNAAFLGCSCLFNSSDNPVVIALHSCLDKSSLIEKIDGLFQWTWIFIGPKRNQLEFEDENKHLKFFLSSGLFKGKEIE